MNSKHLHKQPNLHYARWECLSLTYLLNQLYTSTKFTCIILVANALEVKMQKNSVILNHIPIFSEAGYGRIITLRNLIKSC